MILDLHNHSIKSDDGRAKVENYCQWIRSRDIPIDGLVLTEHRQFEPTDYSALEKKFGLVILEGSEVETEYGHVLVYGITEGLIYSFPCRCSNGQWEIVQGLDINEFSQGKMAATEQELAEERDAVQHLLP